MARREHPGFAYEVADLRELPFEDASLAGEMQDRFATAGFAAVFQGSAAPEGTEPPYGYMLVRKTGSGSA